MAKFYYTSLIDFLSPSKLEMPMKYKIAISHPILVFDTVLESVSQHKTVDTYIDHF